MGSLIVLVALAAQALCRYQACLCMPATRRDSTGAPFDLPRACAGRVARRRHSRYPTKFVLPQFSFLNPLPEIMHPNTQLFINGAWIPAQSGRTAPVINPAT